MRWTTDIFFFSAAGGTEALTKNNPRKSEMPCFLFSHLARKTSKKVQIAERTRDIPLLLFI